MTINVLSVKMTVLRLAQMIQVCALNVKSITLDQNTFNLISLSQQEIEEVSKLLHQYHQQISI